MTDTKGTEDKKLGLSSGGTLGAKKPSEGGRVRQNISHGRSKAVVVERRRKRVAKPRAGQAAPSPETDQPAAPVEAARVQPVTAAGVTPSETAEGGADKPAGMVLRTLTKEEQAARQRALGSAQEQERAEREIARKEQLLKREEEEQASREQVDAEKRRLEEVSRHKEEEDRREHQAEEERARLAEVAKARETETAEPEEEKPASTARQGGTIRATPKREEAAKDDGRSAQERRSEPKRRTGKLTVARALAGEEERQRSMASMRRAREREKRSRTQTPMPKTKIFREVALPAQITVSELADRMSERVPAVIAILRSMDVEDVTPELIVEADTAELIAIELGHKVNRIVEPDMELLLGQAEDDEELLKPRPPVVTVMGHVDHGKTSLLDAIRHANVIEGEAGGITQHIGAYEVELDDGKCITFIDTPGHAAFTEMRARGAQVTDIVILVVAADDGLMPQSIEAISHARAAGVPIIVAINKIDLPDSNPTAIRQELLQHEIITEELGGDILSVEISALQNTNVDKLLEAVALQAELMELKANPERAASGTVVESSLDKGRGAVATVIVQRGTLKRGDIFVAGSEWGRVRSLNGSDGKQISSAGPSMPVEILGFNATPSAGEAFNVVEDEQKAREIVEFRRDSEGVAAVTEEAPLSFEELLKQSAQKEERSEVPVLIKADVHGSAEAIADALGKLSTDEVIAEIVHRGVGAINESDVMLATTSGATIIGFNVRANKKTAELAETNGIEIRYYEIIYDLIDDIKAAMSGLLAPSINEIPLGSAEVREVFAVSRTGKVAGCLVTDGVVRKGSHARLLRNDVVVHTGILSSVRRFKDEVNEVNAGTECGLTIENYQDIHVGDIIDIFDVEEVERSL